MITYNELKRHLIYDKDTGLFFWNINKRNVKIGTPAGCIKSDRRIVIKICQKSYKAHRLAWFYYYGEIPIMEIDHINGNPSDNRICNLRLATSTQNKQNTKIKSHNKSGYKGVYWSKRNKKWISQITVNKKKFYLCLFDDIKKAYAAYISAAKNNFGEFANF